ncbi:hypothetical protein F7725_028723, partial [Dissostichus mawsoni]
MLYCRHRRDLKLRTSIVPTQPSVSLRPPTSPFTVHSTIGQRDFTARLSSTVNCHVHSENGLLCLDQPLQISRDVESVSMLIQLLRPASGGGPVLAVRLTGVFVGLPVAQDVERGAGGDGWQAGLRDLQLLEVGVDRRVGAALTCRGRRLDKRSTDDDRRQLNGNFTKAPPGTFSECLYLPKMLSYSSSMSSTIWFWYTMWTAMLPVSVSGRSSVGPNTMATLWVVMRLASRDQLPWGE